MKKGVACKKKCVGIFVLKTVQNLEQLRLVSSIDNENNKNDKRVLGIVISKNSSLDFCCENTLVKIKKRYAKLSAAANTFLKMYVRGLIEEGNNLFKASLM